jgi:hypothetical protein
VIHQLYLQKLEKEKMEHMQINFGIEAPRDDMEVVYIPVMECKGKEPFAHFTPSKTAAFSSEAAALIAVKNLKGSYLNSAKLALAFIAEEQPLEADIQIPTKSHALAPPVTILNAPEVTTKSAVKKTVKPAKTMKSPQPVITSFFKKAVTTKEPAKVEQVLPTVSQKAPRAASNGSHRVTQPAVAPASSIKQADKIKKVTAKQDIAKLTATVETKMQARPNKRKLGERISDYKPEPYVSKEVATPRESRSKPGVSKEEATPRGSRSMPDVIKEEATSRESRSRDDTPGESRSRDDTPRESRTQDDTPRESRSRDDAPRESRTRYAKRPKVILTSSKKDPSRRSSVRIMLAFGYPVPPMNELDFDFSQELRELFEPSL